MNIQKQAAFALLVQQAIVSDPNVRDTARSLQAYMDAEHELRRLSCTLKTLVNQASTVDY